MLERLVVIDTNVLVSALLSPQGQPFRVISEAFRERITPCYDQEMLEEYRTVLSRPKFAFSPETVTKFFYQLERCSYYVFADETGFPEVSFTDEDDRKFYDLAHFCKAKLITGNKRHFPNDDWIMSPTEFLEAHLRGNL